MLGSLAGFLYANGRRVLIVAVIGAIAAAVFGFGVAKRMSPYGADDPATQSVQASNRYKDAAGHLIDPGVVALVSSGNVHSAAARQRVDQVADQLRHSSERRGRPHLLHEPQPGDGLERRALDVRARVLQAALRQGAEGRRHPDREPLQRPARRQARRRGDGERPGQHPGRARPRARRAARVPDHPAAVAAVLPLARRGAAAAAARRPDDRRHVLRAAGGRRASSTCRCSR